ncbi:MAG: hypothetical protein IPM58_17520 [Nitrospira sp.]|nr:hypothetical protein [Nitrospira sp.]
MDWCSEVARRMQVQLTRVMFIAAVTMLYVLVALPLPYLLIDHYSAIQAGDTNHSDVDIHAWLEWAASSGLSGTVPVLPSVLVPSRSRTISLPQIFSVFLDSALQSRGPPALG